MGNHQEEDGKVNGSDISISTNSSNSNSSNNNNNNNNNKCPPLCFSSRISRSLSSEVTDSVRIEDDLGELLDLRETIEVMIAEVDDKVSLFGRQGRLPRSGGGQSCQM